MSTSQQIATDLIPQLESEEPNIRRIQLEAMCRKANTALIRAAKLTEDDPPWLWRLSLNGAKELDSEDVKSAFFEAAKGNTNADLMAKFSHAMSNPVSDEQINAEINKIDWFLLDHWLSDIGRPFEASLCYYNDSALTKVIESKMNWRLGSRNPKGIRKSWERLGLKKHKTLLFRDLVAKGARLVPIPYPKVIQH